MGERGASFASGIEGCKNMHFCETNRIGMVENLLVTCTGKIRSGNGRENLNPVRLENEPDLRSKSGDVIEMSTEGVIACARFV
jgi:hypothetical protein